MGLITPKQKKKKLNHPWAFLYDVWIRELNVQFTYSTLAGTLLLQQFCCRFNKLSMHPHPQRPPTPLWRGSFHLDAFCSPRSTRHSKRQLPTRRLAVASDNCAISSARSRSCVGVAFIFVHFRTSKINDAKLNADCLLQHRLFQIERKSYILYKMFKNYMVYLKSSYHRFCFKFFIKKM